MLTKHDTGPVYFLVSSCYSCLASGICSFRVFVSQDLLTPYVLPLKCSCSSSWPDPHFRALPTPLLASASSLPLNTKQQRNPGLLACLLSAFHQSESPERQMPVLTSLCHDPWQCLLWEVSSEVHLKLRETLNSWVSSSTPKGGDFSSSVHHHTQFMWS